MIKEAFQKYLEDISMSEPFRKRVETVYEFYKEKIAPEEINDIFISDIIKKNGERLYQNLWFFSDNFMMEAKEFIGEDNFDTTPVHNRVVYYSIIKQEYDFENANDKSRFTVNITLDTDVTGVMKATKENCNYLKLIVLKYIKPNLKQ